MGYCAALVDRGAEVVGELLEVLKQTRAVVHTGCWCCLVGETILSAFWLVGLVLWLGAGLLLRRRTASDEVALACYESVSRG